MKISIFPDAHCGYAYGEERGEDSFNALAEAVEKSKDSDLILIAGDLFDIRLPRPEVFSRTAKILRKAQQFPNRAKLVSIFNKDENDIHPTALQGVPIVAIHGNHDRRSHGLVNPVQAMEHVGMLTHLERSSAVFEVNGEKVAIHGMSNVSERYAKQAMDEWNPKPVEGAFNILIIHQSVDPYIYSPLEPPSLKLDELPQGFDLYVLGHMHWHEWRKFRNADLLVTGSMTYTSLGRVEMDQTKMFFSYDTHSGLQPVELRTQRRIYYREIELSGDVKAALENELSALPLLSPKPIYVFKLKGSLPRNIPLPSFGDIEAKYAHKAVMVINRSSVLEDSKFHEDLLKALKDQRRSPEELGLELLKRNLLSSNCSIRVEEIFELLVSGDIDDAFDIINGTQKVLPA